MYFGILLQFGITFGITKHYFTKITNNNKYSHKVLYIQASYKVLLEKKNILRCFFYTWYSKTTKKKRRKRRRGEGLPSIKLKFFATF